LKTQNKFWWFVFVAVSATFMVLCTLAILFWQHLSPEKKSFLIALVTDNFAYLFTAIVLLFTAFGFTLDWFFRFYIIPVNQLADETDLINTVNPTRRVSVEGSHDVMRLAHIINQCAEHQTTFRQSIEHELNTAKAQAETERNILAALLEDLSQGIVVSNLDGHIVFYNRKAKTLLTQHAPFDSKTEKADEDHWIGLGRSIYDIIDKALIDACLERMGKKAAQELPVGHERFLVGTRASMLPVEILPVLDSHHHITGFILIVEDQEAKLQHERQIGDQLQNWRHQLIQSIAIIKSTAEILKDSCFNTQSDRDQLMQILFNQTNLAAQLMIQSDVIEKWAPKRPWVLTQIDLAEWLQFLQHRIAELSGLFIEDKHTPPSVKISIDIHNLSGALIWVLEQIKAQLGIEQVALEVHLNDGWIYLDLFWSGRPVEQSVLSQWKKSVPRLNELKLTNTVGQILESHGAKLWIGHLDLPVGHSGLRLLLPGVEDTELVQSDGLAKVLPDSRPEFYDFNLFQQSGQTPELDDRPLNELTFTVFDTETTGLDPQGGDEIISIGAVRIVNARLLTDEFFDQLINPQRSLPWASVKYHGIRAEMLENQPTIEQVLPRFHNFTKDTVLLGHNVAFDMRMLQMKEEKTGIRFEHPVLDTMLLSAAVHQAHKEHSLSAVADRLGVTVTHRHTALGDAMTTGRIFLKLLPILANRGVLTLRQAIKISEKTYYARLKY
jgi:DNA polymerase-3 subunit epsilon